MRPLPPEHCPVHFALSAFEDGALVLVLRSFMFQSHASYEELLRPIEGLTPDLLKDCLVRLLRQGLVVQRPGGGRRIDRGSYRLTAKGRSLVPILFWTWQAAPDWFRARPKGSRRNSASGSRRVKRS